MKGKFKITIFNAEGRRGKEIECKEYEILYTMPTPSIKLTTVDDVIAVRFLGVGFEIVIIPNKNFEDGKRERETEAGGD